MTACPRPQTGHATRHHPSHLDDVSGLVQPPDQPRLDTQTLPVRDPGQGGADTRLTTARDPGQRTSDTSPTNAGNPGHCARDTRTTIATVTLKGGDPGQGRRDAQVLSAGVTPEYLKGLIGPNPPPLPDEIRDAIAVLFASARERP